MTPEKLQSIAFKWFEPNNKELENYYLFTMMMRNTSVQKKPTNQKQMASKVNKLYGNGGRIHLTGCRA
jgi:hypothetical protein